MVTLRNYDDTKLSIVTGFTSMLNFSTIGTLIVKFMEGVCAPVPLGHGEMKITWGFYGSVFAA